MADAVELAVAYLQIVPSMEGAQSKIIEGLVPGADKAGAEAGGKFGSKFSSGIGKLAVPAAIAGFGIAAAAGLYQVGATFDDVADTIRIGTGLSGDALDGMVDVAKNVGRNVPVEFDKIGPVVADLNTRLGLSGEVMETVASQYLEAGRILGEDVDIQRTSAAFTTFGIEGAKVEGAMDSLFQVSQATGVGMNELADAAAKNAPAAKLLGLSFEDTTAMIGAFDKAGLNSTALMSGMAKGLVTLAKKGEEPKAAFERVAGEIGTFLEKGDEAGALDLASKVFGTKGAMQFVDAIKSGTLATGDMMGAIGASSDTILGVGAETADFAEKWQLVKNNALLAMEPLGAAVFDALGNALSGLMPHITSFGAWLGENQWVIGAFATAIGVGLVAAFGLWAASIWVANAALLANPITWIVLAIVALIGGLILLISNWDAVAAWLGGVWSAVVDGVAAGWEWLSTTLAGIGQAIWSGMVSIWTSIVSAVTGGVSAAISWVASMPGRAASAIASLGAKIAAIAVAAWQWLARTFSTGVSTAITWAAGLPGKAVSALSSLGSKIAQVASQAWEGFKSATMRGVNLAVDAAKKLPGQILSGLSGAGRWLVSVGSDMMQGFISGVKNMGKRLVDSVLGPINDALGGAKRLLGIASPSRVFMELGGYTGEGYALGMDDTVADITASANRMVTASIPGVDELRAAGLLTARGAVGLPDPSAPMSLSLDGYEMRARFENFDALADGVDARITLKAKRGTRRV